MPDSSEEKDFNNLDGKDKTHESSTINDNQTKITTVKDNKNEELNLEEKNSVRESSSDLENDIIQNAESAATKTEESKPPVSVCFKKTSEVVSKESYVSMLEDINLFFSNLKEFESRRNSKRKNSALEDSDEKSNPSVSEEHAPPAKKLLFETPAKEAIPLLQFHTSGPCSSITAASPENLDSTMPNIASDGVKYKHQNTNYIHNSTESSFEPPTVVRNYCHAATSTEDPPSIADRSNTVDLPMDTTDVPDHLRNEETGADFQPEIEDPPVEHSYMGDYAYSIPHRNGVRKHNFPGTFEVQIIVPLFEYLLNDLLELRSFLDGQVLPPTRPAEESSQVTSSEISPLDRQLAFITEEFGTGVESVIAQTTIEALVEWENHNLPGEDSESEITDGPELQSDYTETSPESSTDRKISESNSSKIPESTASQAPSSIAHCSKSDVHSTKTPPPTDSNSFDETELEQNRTQNLENTPETSNSTCTDIVAVTDTLRLNSEIDLLRCPSEIASLLRALNAVGINYFNSCVATVKSILSACLMHGVYFFNRNLADHMIKMLDMMRSLVALRQECSNMLKKCSDRSSNAGVTFILKVKTHVARSYNQLLVKILAINNDFHKLVKARLPPDAVD